MHARTMHRTDRNVSDDTLRQIYELVKWGPTSGNLQSAHIVFVRSEEGRQKLYPPLEGMGSNAGDGDHRAGPALL